MGLSLLISHEPASIQTQSPAYESLPVAQTTPLVLIEIAETIVAPVEVPVRVTEVETIVKPRLIIPKINVDATIESMGYTPEGAMAVPDNNVDVGWFNDGTRVGGIGSAVIGGHNWWNDDTGVFDQLHRLAKGDVLSVIDAKGVSLSFVVRETRTYDPTDDGASIFLSEGGVHLNLITCSGVFDPSTGTYTKRLVVFTDAV